MIKKAADANNVFDFNKISKEMLHPYAYHYLMEGADDLKIIQINQDIFQELQIRTRRLIDVSNVDTSLRLFGQKLKSPIILCPTARNKMFHPQAEFAIARAAYKKNIR